MTVGAATFTASTGRNGTLLEKHAQRRLKRNQSIRTLSDKKIPMGFNTNHCLNSVHFLGMYY